MGEGEFNKEGVVVDSARSSCREGKGLKGPLPAEAGRIG